MDITRCLTISTAHISSDTARKLSIEPDTNMLGLSVYEKGEFGWWIYVGDNSANISKDLPLDLMACISEAFTNNCQWLCLDCDGEEIDSLPTYDW